MELEVEIHKVVKTVATVPTTTVLDAIFFSVLEHYGLPSFRLSKARAEKDDVIRYEASDPRGRKVAKTLEVQTEVYHTFKVLSKLVSGHDAHTS